MIPYVRSLSKLSCDQECVVLSLVSHNSRGEVGKLLTDWRRINVALTRAKSKLVLVGSASTLENQPHASLENHHLLARMVQLLRARGAFITLPPSSPLTAATPGPPHDSFPPWAFNIANQL